MELKGASSSRCLRIKGSAKKFYNYLKINYGLKKKKYVLNLPFTLSGHHDFPVSGFSVPFYKK
jgi:hypothetical protein